MGSTGSIGTQTLDIIESANQNAAKAGREPAYEVTALGAAGGKPALLALQARAFGCQTVVLGNERNAAELRNHLGSSITVDVGDEAFAAACADADVVINGIVGFAGLTVTLATLRSGKRLGLANKESLIAAGPVVQRVRATPGAEIVPVDSEHCALHQCLRANESFEPRTTRSGLPTRRHGKRRALSWLQRQRTRSRDSRGSTCPPDMVDGAKDHG